MKVFYFGSLLFSCMGIPLAMDVAAPNANYAQAFGDIADKFGLWAAVATALMIVIIATTWLREKTAWTREQNMAKRITELETALIDVVKQQKDVQIALALQTQVLTQVAKSAEGQTKVLERIEIIFSQKVCPFNPSGK